MHEVQNNVLDESMGVKKELHLQGARLCLQSIIQLKTL